MGKNCVTHFIGYPLHETFVLNHPHGDETDSVFHSSNYHGRKIIHVLSHWGYQAINTFVFEVQ